MARGIPTSAELAEALRDFLYHEVMPQTSGRLQFHARVAGNTAAMLERELRLGRPAATAHRVRLGALGVADDVELASAIRDGRFDGRLAEVVAALRASTAEALAMGNPRYLEPRDVRS